MILPRSRADEVMLDNFLLTLQSCGELTSRDLNLPDEHEYQLKYISPLFFARSS